ncbi:MAG: hypothetical protein AAF363_13965 [Bacteroidota bacterium]
MIEKYRKEFNKNFSQAKYQAFLDDIAGEFNYSQPFRVAETPIFLPNEIKNQLLEACHEILDVVYAPDFKGKTEGALEKASIVPGEDEAPVFLAMDFGMCLDEKNKPIPQLIELQGFPTLNGFQYYLADKHRKHYNIPDSFSTHPEKMSREEYVDLLKKVIVGGEDPKQVVLLDIEPEKQATKIDFLFTEKMLGIKILCLSDLKKRGKSLYYLNEDRKEITVKRIYNRVIFDELYKREDLPREFHFTDEIDAEWVGHPNWFYRASKYTLPYLNSKYVPESHYLSPEIEYPDDLQNYVLKPLYSFAGSGVELNVTEKMLDGLEKKENYILQKKVSYARLIESNDDPAKFEIRMMTVYDKETKKVRITNNLVRLSKGEMIGVKYNKDKEWVGASIAFFEG